MAYMVNIEKWDYIKRNFINIAEFEVPDIETSMDLSRLIGGTEDVNYAVTSWDTETVNRIPRTLK